MNRLTPTWPRPYGLMPYGLILAMTTLGAFAATTDTVALFPDCSDSQPADIAVAIHKSDPVRVRYGLGGNSETCYAVSAVVNGKTVEGYLLGEAHPDVAAFEREARSHIPAIPEPPKPAPTPAPVAQEVKAKPLTPPSPQSFAGLSGRSPDGRRVSLDDISAPTVVLYFWSVNNQNSIREADGLERVYEQYHGKGVSVVGVVSGSSAARVRQVLRDEEVIWPQILDNGDIASRFLAGREAKYYILDRQRNEVAALRSAFEVQRALIKMREPAGASE